MEGILKTYLNIISWQTTIPLVAFILSTAFGAIDYNEKGSGGRAIVISLAGGLIAWITLLLLSLSNNISDFITFWHRICAIISTLIAIIFCIMATKESGDNDLFTIIGYLFFGYIFGLISYYIIFYLGKHLLSPFFPVIKYLLVYIIFHGIFILLFPIITIKAIILIFRNILKHKSSMVIFGYVLFLEILFLIKPGFSYDIQTLLARLLFFLTPFIIVTAIIWRKRTTAVWIGCFMLLLGVTLVQMRHISIWAKYFFNIKISSSLNPIKIVLLYMFLGIFFTTYYLLRLKKTGEILNDKIHLLWMFLAVIINASYSALIFIGDLNPAYKIIFIIFNIFIGLWILFRRRYILKIASS